MSRPTRHCVTICFTLALALADLAAASMKKRAKKLETELVARDCQHTLDDCVALAAKMVPDFDHASELSELLAKVLAVQAVAEANLGRNEKALWHWHTAQDYIESLEDLDLAEFGRAEEILEGRSLDDIPTTGLAPHRSMPK